MEEAKDERAEESTASGASTEVDLDELDSSDEDRELEAEIEKDLEFVIDVPFSVSAELGRTTITIRTLLSLVEGSVIELEKLAGEPLEILINGKLVSRGEVIVVNENYGIRLTDIVAGHETIDVQTKVGT